MVDQWVDATGALNDDRTMHPIDWTILLATLGFIVGYGVWKTRRTNTLNAYLRGDNEDRWWAVTLSVMATQASRQERLAVANWVIDNDSDDLSALQKQADAWKPN